METFRADADNEHMVQPGMVYISHPTEYGTLYTKQELLALAETCRQYACRSTWTEPAWPMP